MLSIPFLAWLYWDPPAKAFTIPFIDRPVAWYGICFVTGFILGYFILQPIFRQFLWGNKRLLERDVQNWSKFIKMINESSHSQDELHQAVWKQFSHQERHELMHLPLDQEPPAKLKQRLLAAFTCMMKIPGTKISRKALEIAYPGAITTVHDVSIYFTDRLTWFMVLGTIIGARLAHVLFYDYPFYSQHPTEILKIWEGGLASHGGTVGVLMSIALFLYVYRFSLPELSFIALIDMLVIPTSLAACFIRIGNFINQEILGYTTSKPWGVIFGHPADRSIPEPRHPVSLYEALCYLCTFVLLYFLWKSRGRSLKKGLLSGLFFVIIFGSRFFIDFLKEPQSQIIDESFLQMGQYLSLPFILLGFILIIGSKKFFVTKSGDIYA